MKKFVLTAVAILLAGTLSACALPGHSTAQENQHLRQENARLKKKLHHKKKQGRHSGQKQTYSDQEYALMAFIKMQADSSNNESIADEVNNIAKSGHQMNWGRNESGSWYINFGAHGCSMKVTGDSVQLTYDDIEGDHMGQGNGHKQYAKAVLAKEVGKYKSQLDYILSHCNRQDHSAADNSSSDDDSDSHHSDHQRSDNDDDYDDDDWEDDEDYDDDEDDQESSQQDNNQQSASNGNQNAGQTTSNSGHQ